MKDQILKLTNWVIDNSTIKDDPDAGMYRHNLINMLMCLSPFELDAVEQATKDEWRATDIIHDIKGMSERDEFFLPRVVGRRKFEQIPLTADECHVTLAALNFVIKGGNHSDEQLSALNAAVVKVQNRLDTVIAISKVKVRKGRKTTDATQE